MTQKHTPEPWQQFEHDKRAIVSEEHPNLSLLSIDDDGLGIFFEEKDARRVVACVNACAGVPNEVLMTVGAFGGFGRDDMVRSVTAQRDDLQRELEQVKAAMKAHADGLVKQRDMVLAALSECSCALNQFDPYDDIDALWQLKSDIDVDSVLKTARAAIASVKGGAA